MIKGIIKWLLKKDETSHEKSSIAIIEKEISENINYKHRRSVMKKPLAFLVITLLCLPTCIALIGCSKEEVAILKYNYSTYLSVSANVENFSIAQSELIYTGKAQYKATAIVKIKLEKKGDYNFKNTSFTIKSTGSLFISYGYYRAHYGDIVINVNYDGLGEATVAFDTIESSTIPTAPTVRPDELEFSLVVGTVIINK